MSKRALGSALLFVLIVTPAASAERPNLGPEHLDAESTHVFVGTVQAVYARSVSTWWRGEEQVNTYYLVEFEVDAVEKGDGLAPGDLAYIRCWQRTKSRRRPTPGPGGHGPIPNAGDRVRAYVAKGEYGPTRQEDNGMTAVYPNGFVLLPPASAEEAVTPRTPTSEAPVRKQGQVLTVDGSGSVVTLSLGTEDGVSVGSRITIARGPSYVAVVEVVAAEARRATARVIPALQKQAIRSGDQAIDI